MHVCMHILYYIRVYMHTYIHTCIYNIYCNYILVYTKYVCVYIYVLTVCFNKRNKCSIMKLCGHALFHCQLNNCKCITITDISLLC